MSQVRVAKGIPNQSLLKQTRFSNSLAKQKISQAPKKNEKYKNTAKYKQVLEVLLTFPQLQCWVQQSASKISPQVAQWTIKPLSWDFPSCQCQVWQCEWKWQEDRVVHLPVSQVSVPSSHPLQWLRVQSQFCLWVGVVGSTQTREHRVGWEYANPHIISRLVASLLCDQQSKSKGVALGSRSGPSSTAQIQWVHCSASGESHFPTVPAE